MLRCAQVPWHLCIFPCITGVIWPLVPSSCLLVLLVVLGASGNNLSPRQSTVASR